MKKSPNIVLTFVSCIIFLIIFISILIILYPRISEPGGGIPFIRFSINQTKVEDGYILERINAYGGSFDPKDKKLVRWVA